MQDWHERRAKEISCITSTWQPVDEQSACIIPRFPWLHSACRLLCFQNFGVDASGVKFEKGLPHNDDELTSCPYTSSPSYSVASHYALCWYLGSASDSYSASILFTGEEEGHTLKTPEVPETFMWRFRVSRQGLVELCALGAFVGRAVQ